MSLNGHQVEESFTDSLRRQAESKRKEYNQLVHDQNRVALQLDRVKAYIQSLNGLLEAEGQAKVQLRDDTKTNVVGRPGNRSKNMPLRKAQWEGMTLYDIVETIVEEASGDIHVDQILPQIYETETQKDRRLAKQSLVSTMRRGAKDSRWVALGQNMYTRIQNRQPELQAIQQ